MRITKRPSQNKLKRDSLEKQKPINMTMTMTSFALPPVKTNMRKTSIKFSKKSVQKKKLETETTIMGSQMLQSYYQTIDKGWIKPSEYLKQIKQLNLIGDGSLDMNNYQIKLNEKVDKNMGKLQSLLTLMQKWISILKKILKYTVSKKSNTPYLIEQVKFWKELSKKFDELQYQFNNQKTQHLLVLMKNSLKTKPEYKKSFDEFVRLKDTVIQKTPLLRKLYLSLEQRVSGNIQNFIESSDIVLSTQYLKRILLAFQMIIQNSQIGKQRMEVVFDKMNDSMIQKLTVAPLYPRQLANISSLKQKYAIIDKSLSFYSNFIGIIQQQNNGQMLQILQKAEHTRNVLINLLQMTGYFEFLYKKKEVLQFSKIFSIKIQFNIFDYNFKEEWDEYMETVNESMGKKNYDP